MIYLKPFMFCAYLRVVALGSRGLCGDRLARPIFAFLASAVDGSAL